MRDMRFLLIFINLLIIIKPLISEDITWNSIWGLGCDFPGNDLLRVRGQYRECNKMCANTVSCTHYVFNTTNGGTCWLKQGQVKKEQAVSIESNEFSICGLLQPLKKKETGLTWQGNLASGCDFPGNDLSSVNGAIESCNIACASTSGCTHFSWTFLNGGTCWLKSGGAIRENAIKSRMRGIVCGILDKASVNLESDDKAASDKDKLTFKQFFNAIVANKYPAPSVKQYTSLITQYKSKGGITSKRELAMFLAHILWQSDGLVAKEEYACKNGGCPGHYGSSKYIGKEYYGRGYMQLSWNYNYEAASFDLYGDDRLLKDPDQVAQDEESAWATAFWYWKKNVSILPEVKDGEFGSSTKAINGALECPPGPFTDKAKKRFFIYKNVLKQFEIEEEPIENGCYN